MILKLCLLSSSEFVYFVFCTKYSFSHNSRFFPLNSCTCKCYSGNKLAQNFKFYKNSVTADLLLILKIEKNLYEIPFKIIHKHKKGRERKRKHPTEKEEFLFS